MNISFASIRLSKQLYLKRVYLNFILFESLFLSLFFYINDLGAHCVPLI